MPVRGLQLRLGAREIVAHRALGEVGAAGDLLHGGWGCGRIGILQPSSRAALPEADAAVLLTTDSAAFDAVLNAHLDMPAPLLAVWILYAKGNCTDISFDPLWSQLAEYEWRAVSQASSRTSARP